MFFQEDYNAPPEEESPPAGGARLFFWLLGGEAAGLLKLNLLFLLACLPAVTIPPAYHALHRLARRLVQGRGVRCWPQFWEIVRKEWKTAWAAFLLTALPLAGAGYGMQFYLQFAGRNPVFYLPFTLCATIFLTALLASSYLWGLLADGRRLDRETVLLAMKLGLGKPLRGAGGGGMVFVPDGGGAVVPAERDLSAAHGILRALPAVAVFDPDRAGAVRERGKYRSIAAGPAVPQ